MAKAKTPVPTYDGPASLDKDVQIAITVLTSQLGASLQECETHTHLDISGFGSPATMKATAVYLVGSIAQCIQADMEIRAALYDDATRSRDLLSDIVDVIGDASRNDTFKIMERDPWMWEAIGHMLFHLAKSKADFHPSGRILAKTQVKYDLHDHGLDLIAIYEADLLGITAGESKAYLNDPAKAITGAANRLKELDDTMRDVEIRATITQLRPSLTAAQQAKLGNCFWRQERTYYPMVCCDDQSERDWIRNRKVLRDLAIPVSRKFLLPFAMPAARTTFDQIAEFMRAYAQDQLPN
jgi:hypothetical protein